VGPLRRSGIADSERDRWLRAIVAYDGTDFCGFQIQRPRGELPGSGAPRTVQGALEDALAQILQKPTALLAAGRTDSGVHATGQVVAFGADWEQPLGDLQGALNAVLPDDVVVRALSPAGIGFHPRYDALSRTYCYTIWNGPLRSPLFRRTALWVRRPLNLELMNEATQLIVGSHDFGTFGTAPRMRRQGDARERVRTTTGVHRADTAHRSVQAATVRHVMRAAWSKVDEQHLLGWQRALLDGLTMGADIMHRADIAHRGESEELPVPVSTVHGAQWQGLVEFTIEANAFLYRMVRSIVGTLIQVGRGGLAVAEFASALDGADRALAGPTAAPQGLCLIGVQYGVDAYIASCADHRADVVHRR